ncbi:MAG: peptide-methionine (S)-S-oxide reductase MsrA [Gallionella sp.]|nr:peptide-methionine (S)-S-oxide reductase MsrA [Gallionella sp.]MDD4959143.1 peptide-methionine (S)-S-oxide reductase MsrA [Gallionella sp.]
MLTPEQIRQFFSQTLTLSLGARSHEPSVPVEQTVVFAGGCFWGVDAVFKHIKGVTEVVAGYAGGKAETACYESVCSGNTDHAEAVLLRFDPTCVSYQQLLQVFFSVAHNPTQLNHQGNDVGSQYRSAIFYTHPDQQRIAQDYIQQLTAAHTFPAPIVTQIVPLQAFYPAEAYHQNYLALHPTQPYIVLVDQPKVAQLRKQFPDLYH